jgi:hypothetical protein
MAIMTKVSFLTRRKTKGFLEARKRKEIIKMIKFSEKEVRIKKGKYFRNTDENKQRLDVKRIKR